MHRESVSAWQHDHTFVQEYARAREARTWWVIGLTGMMMVVEIAAGAMFGSMALLADGLHMASHAGALGVTAFGYGYARRHASDPRFSFGTGKVNSLAGFAGAILLAVFAVVMAWQSLGRLLDPVTIAFNEAIGVAVLGLAVNGVSVVLLGVEHDEPYEQTTHGHLQNDHNLRSAYLHVLADALTSVLAILALCCGKYLGYGWMDPAMGVVGAALVCRWSLDLLRATARVLLDRQAPEALCERVREVIESCDGDRVSDLHLWSVGPGVYAAIISVVTDEPGIISRYKERLPADLGIVHVSVEVQRCADAPDADAPVRFVR